MKQTFTKDSIVLHEGEIYLTRIRQHGEFGNMPFFTLKGIRVAACTIPIKGAFTLDRKAFVKPVDVEALAKEYASSQGDNARSYAVAHDWLCGRNSNPNEFTREDMISAMYAAFSKDLDHRDVDSVDEYIDKYIKGYLDRLQPLSIPASVTIENNQVIEVIW